MFVWMEDENNTEMSVDNISNAIQKKKKTEQALLFIWKSAIKFWSRFNYCYKIKMQKKNAGSRKWDARDRGFLLIIWSYSGISHSKRRFLGMHTGPHWKESHLMRANETRRISNIIKQSPQSCVNRKFPRLSSPVFGVSLNICDLFRIDRMLRLGRQN